MPCFQRREIMVNLEIGRKHPNLLKKALEKMGFTVEFTREGLRYYGVYTKTGMYHRGTYNAETGKIRTAEGNELDVNDVKEAYGRAAVEAAAKSNSWQLKKTATGWEATKSCGPFKKDVVKIDVLKDGTIKTTTDKISGPNHQSAESFLADVAKKAGGQVVVRARATGLPKQTHSHDQTHEHGHE